MDHPDGLYDPSGYFTKLQQKAREVLSVASNVPQASLSESPLYVLIEKILEHGEELAKNWTVHGTTGYDYMNVINGVFVEKSNEKVQR